MWVKNMVRQHCIPTRQGNTRKCKLPRAANNWALLWTTVQVAETNNVHCGQTLSCRPEDKQTIMTHRFQSKYTLQSRKVRLVCSRTHGKTEATPKCVHTRVVSTVLHPHQAEPSPQQWKWTDGWYMRGLDRSPQTKDWTKEARQNIFMEHLRVNTNLYCLRIHSCMLNT